MLKDVSLNYDKCSLCNEPRSLQILWRSFIFHKMLKEESVSYSKISLKILNQILRQSNIININYLPSKVSKGRQSKRITHSCFVFFLGNLLFSASCSLRSKVANLFKANGLPIIWGNDYYWALISIFHDSFYWVKPKKRKVIEEALQRTRNYGTFSLFSNAYSFPLSCLITKNDLWDKCISEKPDSLIDYCLNHGAIDKNEPFDHGVIGGAYTFNSLMTGLYFALDSFCKKNDAKLSTDGNSFYWKQYGSDNKECLAPMDYVGSFYIVSLSICAHNVWALKKSQTANSMNLAPFLQKDYVMIKPNKNCLLWILGIADTIDPSKRFHEINLERVLRSVNISLDGTCLRVVIDKKILLHNKRKSKRKKICIEVSKWIDGMVALSSWVDVETHPLCFSQNELGVLIDMKSIFCPGPVINKKCGEMVFSERQKTSFCPNSFLSWNDSNNRQ